MKSWSCFFKKSLYSFVSTVIKYSSIHKIFMKCASKTNFSLSFMEFNYQITSTILSGIALNSFSSLTKKVCNGTQSIGRFGDDRFICLALPVNNISQAMSLIDVHTIRKSRIFPFAQMWVCIPVVRVKSNDLKIQIIWKTLDVLSKIIKLMLQS